MRYVQKGISRIAFVCLLALVVLLSVFQPINNALANDGGVSDLSLYQRASELTREFATALAPGSKVKNLYMIEKTSDDGLLVAGNAGALLGYAEILSDDTGIIGWLMNSYTQASATITYDQLMHVVGDQNVRSAVANNPFFQYAGYGEVLTEMGLITTVRPGLGSGLRIIGTGLTLIVYLLANAAPFLFRGALLILVTLNPFKLFETVFNGTAAADLGIISGVAEYVGSMYEAVQSFSIVFLFPMMLALTAFTVLVFNKGGAMKRFARYAVRVFMLFAGLPLIGATYTGLVEDLESKVSVGSEYADYLVLSSYVDFENWVKYSRLAPPKNSQIYNPRFEEDETRSLSDRALILEVNGTRANNERAQALKNRYSSTSDVGEIFEEGGSKKDADSQTMSATEKSSFSKVYNLLSRHMTSAKYTSSDYNGEVSGQIQKIRTSASETDEENIMKMFSLSASESRTWAEKLNPFDDTKDWMKPIHWNGEDNEMEDSAKGLFTEGKAKYPLFQFGKYEMNIYNSGDLRYTAGQGYVAPAMPDVVTKKSAPIGSDRAATVGGLSPIAMYNFLNTTFSNTGLTVYSPAKTSTDLSRDAYAAVTFGGTGVSSFTRWVENIVVMASLATLSIAYGVMMISVAIKNIPRILSGVFGTALGSIAFATKLLISTAVLIIQVIGMIFLYALSENIIMTMLLNFNELVDTGGDYFGAGVIFEFLGSMLITVITLTVTIFMIKNMTIFKQMMEEVVSNGITRVMGALDTSTGGKGLDVSRMTGGRVGGDGKLTDAAKAADTGPLSGIAGLMGAAHGIEARREQLAEELNPDGSSGIGKLDKLKNRARTAKDLMGASAKDTAKGLVGINGKSLERELDAKERALQAMPYNADLMGRNGEKNGIGNSTHELGTGAYTTADGEMVSDAKDQALAGQDDAATAVAMAGNRAMVGANGELMDTNGNTYMDEAGNAFYQNKKGQLIDEAGNFVALDKDGTLQPIANIPGHNGKPVNALKAAQALDAIRADADKLATMTAAQDATHYGLDANGQAVGVDGQALQTKDGKAVQMDEQGFLTDARGKRLSANEIAGQVDARGFEQVEDAATGATYLQHKGDNAMKNGALAVAAAAGGASLTDLARKSNKANELAQRANQQVSQLKANGAPKYAVRQAERYANKMNQNAQAAQQAFNAAMATSGQGNSGAANFVTGAHVTSAARHASAEKAKLDESVDKLNQMKADGVNPAMIQRQKRKVEAQRVAYQQAANMEQDLRVAQTSGRSYNEVQSARSRVEQAEQVFQNAQAAHAEAVAKGQSQQVIEQKEQRLNQASKVLSNAQANLNTVSQKPVGTPQQIDKATAVFTQAKARLQQATSKVQSLQSSSTPPSKREMQQARREQAKAKREMDTAYQQRQQLLTPSGGAQVEPTVQTVPKSSQSKSYAELTSVGVSSYSDYSKQVQQHTSNLKSSQSKLKQAQQRLATLKASKRPQQIIDQADSQVTALQASVKTSQDAVQKLKDNAHGLLKQGNFQPSAASRPIRQNGPALINQMIHMNQTQTLYDKLAYQEKAGTITEAGRKQLKQLGSRLSYMKRDLVRAGIREDAISDAASTRESVKQFQQSWDAFVNGTSVENE